MNQAYVFSGVQSTCGFLQRKMRHYGLPDTVSNHQLAVGVCLRYRGLHSWRAVPPTKRLRVGLQQNLWRQTMTNRTTIIFRLDVHKDSTEVAAPGVRARSRSTDSGVSDGGSHIRTSSRPSPLRPLGHTSHFGRGGASPRSPIPDRCRDPAVPRFSGT